MRNDLLNHSLLLKILERGSRKRSIDLQSVDKYGDRDETVRLHILLKFLAGAFVEDDGVV